LRQQPLILIIVLVTQHYAFVLPPYQLNLVSGDHKNPEYRIADDVRVATEAPVDFVTGMTTAVLSAATFIVVLWSAPRGRV
jgi:ABC-type uncharacterized transport system fused permease/ATPase subunit